MSRHELLSESVFLDKKSVTSYMRALLIEDVEQFCEIFKAVFEPEISIDCAYNVEDVWEKRSAGDEYDLYFLDLNLGSGREDGLNLLYDLSDKAPVIVVSAALLSKDEQEKIEKLAAGFLSKQIIGAKGIYWFARKVNEILLNRHLYVSQSLASKGIEVLTQAQDLFRFTLKYNDQRRKQSNH